MLPTTSSKPRVLSRRVGVAGLSAFAALATFLSTADSAHAGAKERNLVLAALNGNADATPSQLQAAVLSVLQSPANAKLKAGIVAGEALKIRGAVTNAGSGEAVAQAVKDFLGANTASATLTAILGDAGKTAGTGPGPIVLRIPAFTGKLLQLAADPTPALTSLNAAALAHSSKSAVGAIIGGGASQLPNDSAKTSLATQALSNPKTAAAVTEISRYVADTTADDAAFASNIAQIKPANTLKIAPGVVASNPGAAYDVTAALLANTGTPGTGKKTVNATVVAGLTSYAKAVAKVADIEQISLLGGALAQQIGSNVAGATTGKSASLAKILSQAILAKVATGNAGTAANKQEEMAEVAATVAGGIVGNLKITDKNIAGTVVKIVKSVVAGAKSSSKTLKAISQSIIASNFAADAAGSVMATLAVSKNPALTQVQLDAIKAALIKNAKAIVGKDATKQGVFIAAVNEGAGVTLNASGVPSSNKYELGYRGVSLSSPLLALVDPETDNKNFQ